jgi:ABC-type sulfate/molybdate transport systems ATPase subunit
LPKQAEVTVLHITHSQAEAERLGDMVFRLQDGRIETLAGRASDGAFTGLTPSLARPANERSDT